jgi:aminoglycoside phosphotransferase (APT) family kinase protein
VLDLRGPDGEAAVRRLYAKVFRDDQLGEDAFRTQRAVFAAVGAGAELAVARPVAYVAAARIALIDEVPGESLDAAIGAGDPAAAESAARRAARALARLHRLPLTEEDLCARTGERWDGAERARAFGEAVAAADPGRAAEAMALAAAIARRLDATGDGARRGPTHFDLKPAHVLLGERTTLLDLDKLALGDPLIDVGNLLARFAKERASERRGRAPAGVWFAEEYAANAPAEWRGALPAHFALALLAEAAGGRGFRGRVRANDRRVAGLLAQAGAALAPA